MAAREKRCPRPVASRAATALAVVALGVLLAACGDGFAERTVGGLSDPDPAARSFTVCSGYGCYYQHRVALTETEWDGVAGLFEPPSRDAAEERRRVGSAVARLEEIVGGRVGTEADLPESPIVYENIGQQDCIDESVNTTTYLRILAREGHLRWHRLALPARRGIFLDEWPHQTAVMEEIATGRAYAVDSYFFRNGTPAVVMPLEEWRKGWKPERRDA